jgi:hypothetical protein
VIATVLALWSAAGWIKAGQACMFRLEDAPLLERNVGMRTSLRCCAIELRTDMFGHGVGTAQDKDDGCSYPSRAPFANGPTTVVVFWPFISRATRVRVRPVLPCGFGGGWRRWSTEVFHFVPC